jgi:endonuclease/exonuclease/phosphatase family metal-dependent hydrolase
LSAIAYADAGSFIRCRINIFTHHYIFTFFPALARNMRNEKGIFFILQEITDGWNHILQKHIKRKYRYQYIVPHNGTHGIGLFSKYPIRNKKILNNENGLPIAQKMEIEIHDRRILLVNVHLASPALAVSKSDRFWHHYKRIYELRKKQMRDINEMANKYSAQTEAQIIIGDFNTLRIEPLYRDIKYEWIDLYEAIGSGSGYNFPHSRELPLLCALDYIFFRGNCSPVEVDVVQGGSSDHLGISGKIRI